MNFVTEALLLLLMNISADYPHEAFPIDLYFVLSSTIARKRDVFQVLVARRYEVKHGSRGKHY
jgi:hypothetical protein